MAAIDYRPDRETKPYRLRWRNDGKQVSEHFATEREAWKRRLEVEAAQQAARPTPTKRAARGHTLQNVYERWKQNPVSVKTGTDALVSHAQRDLVAGHMRTFERENMPIHTMPLVDICTKRGVRGELLEALRASRTYENASLNRYIQTVSALVKYAIDEEILPPGTPPLRWRKLPEHPPTEGVLGTALTQGQFQRIVENAPAEWRVFFALAVRTGLRMSELLSLKREDLHLKPTGGYIDVRRSLEKQKAGEERPLFKATKTYEQRKAYLTPDIAAAIAEQVNARAADREKSGHDLLFPDEYGNPHPPWRITNTIWPKTRKAAKLDAGYEFRHIRRSFGSHLYNETKDAILTMKAMGHANVKTTLERYARAQQDMPDALRKAMEAFAPITSGIEWVDDAPDMTKPQPRPTKSVSRNKRASGQQRRGRHQGQSARSSGSTSSDRHPD